MEIHKLDGDKHENRKENFLQHKKGDHRRQIVVALKREIGGWSEPVLMRIDPQLNLGRIGGGGGGHGGWYFCSRAHGPQSIPGMLP